jgi:hypothetical protein
METIPIKITRGDTKDFIFNFLDTEGNPINIQNNYDGIYIDLSQNEERQTETIKLEIGNGIEYLSNSSVKVSLNYNQTQELYSKKYWGDVKLKKGSRVKSFFRIAFNNFLSTTKI